MNILAETNGITFAVSSEFQSIFLAPIINNLLTKAETEWDDYDEVYHCCQLIEAIKDNKNMTIDYHVMLKNGVCLGLAMITRGELNYRLFFDKKFEAATPTETTIVLNYFHIADDGRGNGENWISNLIIPFYREKGYTNVYVKSTHPKSFSLYERLGTPVSNYTNMSDNNLHIRQGKIFNIHL